MAVSRERFESGLTYQQYKQQMTRNRERFDRKKFFSGLTELGD